MLTVISCKLVPLLRATLNVSKAIASGSRLRSPWYKAKISLLNTMRIRSYFAKMSFVEVRFTSSVNGQRNPKSFKTARSSIEMLYLVRNCTELRS